MISDESGVAVERLSYDPWGKRRNINGAADTANSITSLTDRGFTNHEHLEQVFLIHMNGRVYDPLVGRFLSADPFIQDPMNTQSLNRYSYVLNNPLCYTDPSGFFFKSIMKFFQKTPVLAVAAGVAMAWATGGFSLANGFTFWGAVTAGATTGALTGGIKGAITGAIGGAIGGWVGDPAFAKAIGANAWVAQSAIMGMSQGVLAEASGGDFGSAFLGAAVGTAAGAAIGKATTVEGLIGKTVAVAAVGGATARLNGGKFANGASTAAFSYLITNYTAATRTEVNRSLTYTTVGGGEEFASWSIKWNVSPASDVGGWIVQEIDGLYTASQNGETVTKTYHYWEAWYVPAGSSQTELGLAGAPFDDIFAIDSHGAIGQDWVKATARFYEGLSLPESFVFNGHPFSGSLRSTSNNPNLPLERASGAVERTKVTEF